MRERKKVVVEAEVTKIEGFSTEKLRSIVEAEERYRAFIQLSSEAIWRFELEEPVAVSLPSEEQVRLFYRHGVLAECNDAMARMYGYESSSQIVGTRLGELLVESEPANIAYLRRFVEAGYHLTDAESFERDSRGEQKVFLNNLIGVVKGGHMLRAWGTQRDITELKRAERTLARQAEELWRSNRDLEQFAYVASHDLKEPLRKVSAFGDLLEKEYGARLDDRGIHFLSAITSSVRRMEKLIDDLLLYSRSSRGESPLAWVDLEALVDDLRDDVENAARKPGGRITHDPLPRIWANQTQIHQLLQNLVGNGLKFQESVAPWVHISAQDLATEWVIEVRDNGIGIEDRYHEQIFQIFQRLHGSRKYQGTGIGLAICKRIVERHKGRIWVESRLGKGSTFFVALPKPDL